MTNSVEIWVQSSVPIQETTSVTTLVLVRLSMDTAKWWGIFSRLWPSTANSLSPHLQGISEQKMHLIAGKILVLQVATIETLFAVCFTGNKNKIKPSK